ncbi:MAG TPA: TerC family protein [Opitutaceae bacterium]|nr:TerC family protein [Opitutaceae bacterium]
MEALPLWAWAAFIGFVIAMLALDLGVFNRKSHVIKTREALGWVAVWVTLALAFNVLIYFWRGRQPALEFLTGYVIELCLSVDNVFVFIVIFGYFKVPAQFQHRVLFWGIVGAAVMRALFIVAGIVLINRFEWVIAIFGAFLVYTGIKLAMPKKEDIHPENNPIVRIFRRFFPVSAKYEGGKFFTVENGRKMATPLFIVLLVIESTDVAFALDSIPAILAITKDPFIVFTSNIFAILGLRSMYFALAGVMQLFRFLNIGLAVILVFIGVKMLLAYFMHFHLEITHSLAFIGTVLTLSVVLSLLIPVKDDKTPAPPTE